MMWLRSVVIDKIYAKNSGIFVIVDEFLVIFSTL